MIEFKSTWVSFDPAKGRKQRKKGHVNFSKNVNSANAAIKGIKIGYTDGDHHIYKFETDIDMANVDGRRVNFNVDFLLRDSSGNIDDRFDGWIEVLVIADVG